MLYVVLLVSSIQFVASIALKRIVSSDTVTWAICKCSWIYTRQTGKRVPKLEG